jgi:glycosyltransferase involved in cell wall biosynthesis
VPIVSVVMSVYNGAQHLEDTIESVLANSGVEYEFIIINDGSSDESLNIIQNYAENYSQVKVIDQENMGLTNSLITGCHQAQGDFIARIDAGDLCTPDRLRLQVDILNNNPDMVLLGSFVNFIDDDNLVFPSPYRQPPLFDKALKKILERENTFSHSSVMFRKDAYTIVGGYREFFLYAQDYDLWWRLSETEKIGIYPQVLSTLRITKYSISFQNRTAQAHYAALSSTLFYAKRRWKTDIEIHNGLEELLFSDNVYLNKILYSHYKAISNMLLLTAGYDLNDSSFDILRQSLLLNDTHSRVKLFAYAILGSKLYMKLKKLNRVNNIKYYTKSKHS